MILFPISLLAAEEEIGYEGILHELSQNQTRESYSPSKHPFDDVLFHMGVNFTSSHLNLILENGQKLSGFHSGIEATFGIDLFSKNWLAEGSVRTFGDSKMEQHEISLKEFDLKITYRNHLSQVLTFFTTFGLAARYLNYIPAPLANEEQGPLQPSSTQSLTAKQFTTPSSLLAIGMATNIGQSFSLGLELGYRRSMISETIEKDALDAVLRLDTHF